MLSNGTGDEQHLPLLLGGQGRTKAASHTRASRGSKEQGVQQWDDHAAKGDFN